MKNLAAILALVMVGSGCAATAEDASPSSSEEALTSFEILDQVTPSEVAKVFADQKKESFAKAAAFHPSITVIDKSNYGEFDTLSHSLFDFDLEDILASLLETRASIPVGEVPALIEPWVQAQLAPYANAQGFFEAPKQGLLGYYYAEIAAREAKANRAAKAPGGKSLTDIRAEWREVEMDRGTLDSAYLRPVKVSGEPTLGQIKKAFAVPYEAELTAWGNDAVDAFASADEGPENAPSFDALKGFLKTGAIQKRWLFQYNGEWSTNMLIVLDEHNQLWGFQMGYSE